MDLRNKLKNRRLELNLTLEEVGNAVGVSKSTVMKWETGYIENMKKDKIAVLAKALRVSPLFIMGVEDELEKYNNSVLIPVYGSIPAGLPLEAVQDIQSYEEIPVNWLKGNKKYIALKVVGDSMYPKYLENDIVIILLQQDCESGKDCAVYVDGYDVTLKKVNISENEIRLTPININYLPKTYELDNVIILGIVVEIRRKV